MEGMEISNLLFHNTHSYFLFHITIEICSILLAFSIFIFNWNTRKYTKHSYLIFLGITAYLSTGILGILHCLSYPGIEIIQLGNNKTTEEFWVLARYIESISILFMMIYYKYFFQTIQKSQVKYEKLIQNITDAVCIVDEFQKIQYESPPMQTLVEQPTKGMYLPLLFHPEDQTKIKTLDTEQPIEVRLIDKNYQIKWIRLTAKLLEEKEHQIILTDITQQKQKETKQRNQVLIETAGAAAHEINQPLTAILAYANLLVNNPNIPESEKHKLNSIYQSGQRISKILDQMQTVQEYDTKPYLKGHIVNFAHK